MYCRTEYNIALCTILYAGALSITRGSQGNVFLKHVKNFNSCLESVTVGVKTVSHASREHQLRQHLLGIIGMRGSRGKVGSSEGSMTPSYGNSCIMATFLVLSSLYGLCLAEKGKP